MQMPLTTAQVNIVSVIETEANNTFVRKVNGITRCMLQSNPNLPDQIKFITDGINLHKLFEYPEVGVKVFVRYLNTLLNVTTF